MIQANPALFAKLAAYPNPATIPPKLAAQAVAAAGGGAKGTAVLATIGANSAAIKGVIAVGPKLAAVAPYAAQLTALAKVPPQVFPYLKAHGAAVQKAAAQAPASGRPGTGCASAGSCSSWPASRCCAAGGIRPAPAATRRNTRRWWRPSWPSSAPEPGPAPPGGSAAMPRMASRRAWRRPPGPGAARPVPVLVQPGRQVHSRSSGQVGILTGPGSPAGRAPSPQEVSSPAIAVSVSAGAGRVSGSGEMPGSSPADSYRLISRGSM